VVERGAADRISQRSGGHQADYGMVPIERSVDLLAGDLSLITGTPETDPGSPVANIAHVGPIIWQRSNAVLPDWITELSHDQPQVWVYCGNPRYAGAAASNPFDSIVVIPGPPP